MFATRKPCLVLIDMQDAIDQFSELPRSHPEAEQLASELLSSFRGIGLPVFHIRHSSKFTESPYHATQPGFAFKQMVAPRSSETVVTKQENCAFLGTPLQQILNEMGISELVVAGVLLNHSVDVTVRVASGLGFKVKLVGDACPALAVKTLGGRVLDADLVHDLFLSNLAGEYAQVVSMASLRKALWQFS